MSSSAFPAEIRASPSISTPVLATQRPETVADTNTEDAINDHRKSNSRIIVDIILFLVLFGLGHIVPAALTGCADQQGP
ncbi:hypothetical protein B0H14DRAFT_3473078 [Mycena olivaceomarginata]|nr:hypothetical protein B0H14DRAFT_3473078 [Mycena olivaceomarginata]